MPRPSKQLPKLNLSQNANYILLGLLVAAAFLIGTMYTKISYLEKGGTTAPAPVAGAPTTPAPGQKVNVSVGHLPVLGNKDAKVTVVEFADFRCPFCERWFTDVEGNLKKDYVDTGKVKFAFRHYAFLGPASTVAANAAECANEQGKFWDFHNYLYKNQPPESDTSMYTVDNLTSVAQNMGMDAGKFRGCLSTNKYQKDIDADFADGQKAGVTGTPATFVNGKLVVGAQPYASFKTLIDQELSK
ncbi:MAG TPA: DsbA family protein [Patescibacteria group bacterium]|nr:DsbA family protein [Patescibacteria group bacterium]